MTRGEDEDDERRHLMTTAYEMSRPGNVWHCLEPRRLRHAELAFHGSQQCRSTARPHQGKHRGSSEPYRTSALLAIVGAVFQGSIDSIASSATRMLCPRH